MRHCTEKFTFKVMRSMLPLRWTERNSGLASETRARFYTQMQHRGDAARERRATTLTTGKKEKARSSARKGLFGVSLADNTYILSWAKNAVNFDCMVEFCQDFSKKLLEFLVFLAQNLTTTS